VVLRKLGGSCESNLSSCQSGEELTERAIERCTFDQARLIRHNKILAKNGIAPDGTSFMTDEWYGDSDIQELHWIVKPSLGSEGYLPVLPHYIYVLHDGKYQTVLPINPHDA
jgi:hypothetical protein